MKNAKWAGSDSNQRPPPCQGSLSSKQITISEGSYVKSSEHTSLANYKVTYSPDFWYGFQSYLSKNNNHLGTRDRLNYAMKYAYILDTGDARQLLELSHEKRMHIMKSLSALAKYTGRYDRWQRIRQNFQLAKKSKHNSDDGGTSSPPSTPDRSIIGNAGDGYDAGKAAGASAERSGQTYDAQCPSGHTDTWCVAYHAGYLVGWNGAKTVG